MKFPDVIICNASIRTDLFNSTYSQALAISNGKITSIGSDIDILSLRGNKTVVYDLNGKLVLPGFTDSHVHFMIGSMSLLQTDFSTAKNSNDFKSLVQNSFDNSGQSSWLLGIGWDETKWDTPVLPSKNWIDDVSQNRKAYFVRQDMHMAVANSYALEAAGITKSSLEPDGGSIDKDPETGEPTGILRDAAMKLVENAIPPPDIETKQRAIKAGLKHAVENGVTAVHDITKMDNLQILAAAADSDDFKLRFSSFLPMRLLDEVVEAIQKINTPLSQKFKIAGVKAFTDGSLGSRTALFFNEYADSPGQFGLPNDIMFPKGRLLELAANADRAGLQMIIHAIGDKANSELLDMYDSIIKKNGYRDRRWRIEHAQHLAEKDFQRFKDLHVVASMQPYHCIDDARWAHKRVGQERCKTMYAFKSMIAHKVPVVFGSDWTVAPLDPLCGIDAAVNRIPTGFSKSWYPEQKISVEHAVNSYTTEAAWSVFDEKRYGSIKLGMYADLVVLSHNIFTEPSKNIKNTFVSGTFFNGSLVYDNMD